MTSTVYVLHVVVLGVILNERCDVCKDMCNDVMEAYVKYQRSHKSKSRSKHKNKFEGSVFES